MDDDPTRYRLAKEILLDALERPSAERAGFVATACGGDAALRAEVESLLDFGADPDPLPPPQDIPERIDRYRIVRLIGEGGMGRLYEAEQDVPRRRVAVKVIRPALANDAVRRRFAREAEFLARLEHPGIARIYDAGGTGAADDTPFLVMELIDGRELSQWVVETDPDRRRRIEVLIAVCDAVEHAHRHGVIHRDLKPSNVLIDAAGRPKVLDFGIARAVDEDARRTLLTDAGQIVGTLAYMSPEQCAAGADAVETRSDIWALGVIAYELLAGRLPIEVDGLPLGTAVRLVQQAAPPRLGSLDRALAGDLDTVVHTALAPDAERRYATAAAFGEDLRRCLVGAPIQARPATTLYQLRRFVGRNRTLVASLLMAALALLIGSGVALWQAAAEREARIAAERSRDGMERIYAFLASMLQAASPFELDRDAPLSELLERAETELAVRFADRPDLRARVLGTLAATWTSIGRDARALPLAESAVAARRAEAAATADPANLGRALAAHADACQNADRFEAGLAAADEALAELRAALGPRHPETLDAALARATILARLDRLQPAVDITREILATLEAADRSPPRLLAEARAQLGRLQLGTAEFAAAADSLRAALDGFDGEDAESRFRRSRLLGELAVASFRAGDAAAALRHIDGQAETIRELGGDDHPSLSVVVSNRGSLKRATGDLAGAEADYVRALAISRVAERSPSRTIAINLNNLGSLYQTTGRVERAIPLLQEALDTHLAIHGADSSNVAGTLGNLADCHLELDAPDRAVALYRRAVDAWRAARGDTHLETVHAEWRLFECRLLAGSVEAAAADLPQLVTTMGRVDAEHLPTLLERMGIAAETARAAADPLGARVASAAVRLVTERSPAPADRVAVLRRAAAVLAAAAHLDSAQSALVAAREAAASLDAEQRAAIDAELAALASARDGSDTDGRSDDGR